MNTRSTPSATHGVVYLLRDPWTDWICYVGKTMHAPHKRLRQHLREARYPKFPITKNRANWLGYLQQMGQPPALEICGHYDMACLDAWEGKWIARFLADGQPLTNGWYPYNVWRELTALGYPNIEGLHTYNPLIDCPYWWLFFDPEYVPDRVWRAYLKRHHPGIADALAEVTQEGGAL